MTICPDCRTENVPGAEFCKECGSDLHSLRLPTAGSEFAYHLMNDRLGDVKAREMPVVAPTDPLAFAIHLMQQHSAECAVVKDDDRLVGIVTERDVLLKASGEKVDLNALTVGQTMTADPVVLREDDTLAVALHKMSVGEFRHIPLEIGGRVTKVVSIRDVFSHASPFIKEQPAPA